MVNENGEINITSEVLHYMANPQILVNFVTNAKELPRSIALERKRRAIAGVDFVDQFNAFMLKVHQDDEAYLAANHLEEADLKRLPLEIFDDCDFESKTIGSWFIGGKPVEIFDASKGQSRMVKGLYGHCWIQGKWQKCLVIGSKKQITDDRLLVQIISSQNHTKFWVPRLFVFVWGEDPAIYI